IRDVLGAGGGVLVPAGDEGALATALRDLLTDADRLAVLRAEAPSVAAAWSPERSLAALTGVVAEVSARPSRRA
ncbi:MAG: glycosyltransferase, partial [Microbacterium sp.]|nr:glycosyltransferase [Microbacterium sp.]